MWPLFLSFLPIIEFSGAKAVAGEVSLVQSGYFFFTVQFVNTQKSVDIKVFRYIHEGQRAQVVVNERNIRRQPRNPFIDILKRLEVRQVKTTKISACIAGSNQAKAVGVFTLMISEISIQKVRTSSTSKTCDMSH